MRSASASKEITDQTGDRLALAHRLFHEYHALCFWHMKDDVQVTEAMIPAIVKGLRLHGGRRGVLDAAKLMNE